LVPVERAATYKGRALPRVLRRHLRKQTVNPDFANSIQGGSISQTFILESFKGRCAARKRGGKPKKTGLSAEQIPVLVARDRTGATLDGVLPKLDRISVTAVLAGVVTARRQPGVL
jgi:hypothetical protein